MKVWVDSGSSGELLSRMSQVEGEGADLYLPADVFYNDSLKNLEWESQRLTVGVFEPVLAVAQGNPKNVKGISDLLREDVHVGLGNPESAIGRLSENVLKHKKMWASLEQRAQVSPPQLSYLGKVTEVAHCLKKQVIDVGLVWRTTALQNNLTVVEVENLKAYQVPVCVSLLSKSKHPQAAQEFATYLASHPKSIEIMRKHYFAHVLVAPHLQQP